MKVTLSLLTAGLAVAAAPAHAAFLELPTSGVLRLAGVAQQQFDPLFIDTQHTGTLPTGYELPDGYLPSFTLPASWTQKAWRETAIILPDEDDPDELEEVGTFYDAVWQDGGSFIFGSRIVMDPTEEGEINDIFRRGFTGFDHVSVAWDDVAFGDLRLYSAARSAVPNLEVKEFVDTGGLDGENDSFDPDVIGLATDVNVEELNPNTGWFFLKLAAPGFVLRENAVGLFQAGEEGQIPHLQQFAGYAPVPVPAAVWLLGSALAGMAGVARRRA